MRNLLVFISPILFFLLACEYSQSIDEEPIARVNKQFLYPSDFGASGMTGDSSAWNTDQMNTWIERQIWVSKALETELDMEIEQLLKDYKESLLITAYQDKLVDEADVFISNQMILDYYKIHQENYLLTEEQYKLKYYLLDAGIEEDEILKSLNSQEENAELREYCITQANKCLPEALWLERGVLEGLEIPQYLWKTSVKFQRYYHKDGTVYLYRIETKKKIGEPAPLEMVSGQIREILKFQKEKEIIHKHGEELLLNAQNQNYFEIY